MSKAAVVSTVKHIVGAPEQPVPYVSVNEYVRERAGDPRKLIVDYVTSLFPFFQWITRYNLGWAIGDIIAGLTVGLVLVPQSMSYAKIAQLAPEYGLYSSFVGVFVYCDVSIGPVAVMSLETGLIITDILDKFPGRWEEPQIATTLAFICGFIVLGVGLLRLGWIVEFIPAPAVSGFMTGSAISIAAGQVPGLFGIASKLNTRAETYKVIINTLKNLHFSTIDAAFGVVGLFFLYAIRWTCEYLSRRYPRRARTFFFISVLRNGFVVIILTLAAYLYLHDKRDEKLKSKYPPPAILLTVPRGFKHVGQPVIDPELVSAMAGKLPVATIILLLEHIAISKSFGRLNGYKINPNQELIAIGVTNTVGSCFAAYPATGSFSRSALKSKSGVRTPAAGWITGIVVIVALYGLTDAFFWIPSAGLSAVIIHAVADLVASPAQVYSFWRVSPLEFLIWAAAVLVTIFSSIENGIYTSVGASAGLLLIRVARPRGEFLGRVNVRGDDGTTSRSIYLPLSSDRGVINPRVKPTPLGSGVLVYRFEESFVYPNSSLINSRLVDYAKEVTRHGRNQSEIPLYDRPWNDPGPPRGVTEDNSDADKPLLRALVLDLSAVAHIDTTGVQNLIDIRKELEKYTDGPVEFHFANISSPWVRRALIAGGFGSGQLEGVKRAREVAPVVPGRRRIRRVNM
ncbi:sulfate permease [Exidia glandulosa HHB12029]|uniref:Sulfate permease n=1 Tax=Exidia glandulosa HHB12029 TaxID=1314781 RepID=A0A165LCN0_EXIGL|nr:sulfate permease [Exidia glandulosa HHB12029]